MLQHLTSLLRPLISGLEQVVLIGQAPSNALLAISFEACRPAWEGA